MKIKLGEYLEKLLVEAIKNLKEPETEIFEIEVKRYPDRITISINNKIIFWADIKILEEVES